MCWLDIRQGLSPDYPLIIPNFWDVFKLKIDLSELFSVRPDSICGPSVPFVPLLPQNDFGGGLSAMPTLVLLVMPLRTFLTDFGSYGLPHGLLAGEIGGAGVPAVDQTATCQRPSDCGATVRAGSSSPEASSHRGRPDGPRGRAGSNQRIRVGPP